MTANSCLPREIVKWLQSLDLSFSVKNPKRDFSNGYIVAEIMSRYHPKDVAIVGYENGTRLAAKVDNWEQLYKLFKKKEIPIAKVDFDAVIHCAPGAAVAFIMKLFTLLTKRTIQVKAPKTEPGEPAQPFMRDTASKRLKDHEIYRIQDNIERTIRAIDTLGYYHEERRRFKEKEAPMLMRHERRQKMGMQGQASDEVGREGLDESSVLDEVAVKALSGGDPRLGNAIGKGKNGATSGGPPGGAVGHRSALLKAVSGPRTSAGALAGLQQPALFVKPAADIMRPLVTSIINENDDLANVIDAKKDIVVEFMEQCERAVPLDVAVRVFETLANRAPLLVDTLTKSAPEFWKVWSTFSPALTDFQESSPVFESICSFFMRIGNLMRAFDGPLTQQLITEVGLPSLAKELKRSPEKREALCAVIYAYTQEDTLNHLLVLRALKDMVNDMQVYVSCLASLISLDAELSLLDEHLLDLYIYYALIAMQSPQPKIRVAGISIVSTITTNSSHHQSILGLIPILSSLANDDWWEVQAQLLQLSAHLLSKLTISSRQDGGAGDETQDPTSGAATPSAAGGQGDVGGGDSMMGADGDPVENLLTIIRGLFVVSNSKNVLQVGLSALVHLLSDYETLQPVYVSVLLEQPKGLRRRLLQPPEPSADGSAYKMHYVKGNATLQYEERCISREWPHLDVAKTFVMQLRSDQTQPLENFDLEHMEVFLASLPQQFEAERADEWLDIFDRVKQYVFGALVQPKLHLHSTQIIKRFWCCNVESIVTKSIEASKKPLLQALHSLYSSVADAKVDEASVIAFLRELRNENQDLDREVTMLLEAFRTTFPQEYESSSLDTVFA